MATPNVELYDVAAPFPARTPNSSIGTKTIGRYPVTTQGTSAVEGLTATELVTYGLHAPADDVMPLVLMPRQFSNIQSALSASGTNFLNWSLFPVVFTSQQRDVPAVQVAPYMCLVTSQAIGQAQFIPSNTRGAGNYAQFTLPRGPAMNPINVAFDTTFVVKNSNDTKLAIMAALQDVNGPDIVYITIFPFVTPGAFEKRVKLFRQFSIPQDQVWSFAGPSLGLAVAAAVAGLPPMMYTGFLSQIGPGITLTGSTSTGTDATLMGANIVENIDLVEYKAAWACSNRYPICVPMSSTYLMPLTETLARIGGQMLITTRDGVSQPSYGVKIGSFGKPPYNALTVGQDYSRMSYFTKMEQAIYTTQDINLGKDFTRYGSYIMVASTFSDIAILAIVASKSIVGQDPTGSFIKRADELASINTGEGMPRVNRLAAVKKAASGQTATPAQRRARKDAKTAKKRLEPTKAEAKKAAARAAKAALIMKLLGGGGASQFQQFQPASRGQTLGSDGGVASVMKTLLNAPPAVLQQAQQQQQQQQQSAVPVEQQEFELEQPLPQQQFQRRQVQPAVPLTDSQLEALREELIKVPPSQREVFLQDYFDRAAQENMDALGIESIVTALLKLPVSDTTRRMLLLAQLPVATIQATNAAMKKLPPTTLERSRMFAESPDLINEVVTTILANAEQIAANAPAAEKTLAAGIMRASAGTKRRAIDQRLSDPQYKQLDKLMQGGNTRLSTAIFNELRKRQDEEINAGRQQLGRPLRRPGVPHAAGKFPGGSAAGKTAARAGKAGGLFSTIGNIVGGVADSIF